MADPILQSPTYPHFFQPLLPGFHSHLSIPLKFFSEHIEGRNKKNMVELKSDAGEKTWKVKMDGRKLTVGWKDFADAHDFRIGDIIIFRHEGDLVFHVTGLGPSCCEIQYVQSSNNDDDRDDNDEEERNSKQNLKTEPESSPDDDDKYNTGKFSRKRHAKKRNPEAEAESCFVAHVTDSNLREDTLFLPKKFVRSDGLNKESNKISLVSEGVRTWTLILKFRESSRTFYMRLGWRSFCQENGLKPGDSVTFKLESNNKKTPLLRFSTPESKSVSTKHCSKGKMRKSGESSQSRVSSALSENRFVTLTVTPSSLEDCRIYLPVSFTRAHKMEKARGKKITLLDKHGVEWPVNLPMQKDTRLWLGSGLKEFLKAIGVKAYESFVLELVWEDTTSQPMLKFCSKIKT